MINRNACAKIAGRTARFRSDAVMAGAGIEGIAIRLDAAGAAEQSQCPFVAGGAGVGIGDDVAVHLNTARQFRPDIDAVVASVADVVAEDLDTVAGGELNAAKRDIADRVVVNLRRLHLP